MRTSIFVGIWACVALMACNTEKKEEVVDQRIVSLSGAITETIVALGAADRLVGVDVTSTFPEEIKQKASDLGHIRSMTLEPILALKPTLVLGLKKDFSPELEEKLAGANIPVKLIDQEYSAAGAQRLIEQVGEFIGLSNSQPVVAQMQAELSKVSPLPRPLKVLFIYARGAGTLMVAGDKTAFSEMVKLAGGQNAVSGFEDFKPLTPEALVQGNPDVILLFDSGLASVGGVDGLLKVPGVVSTSAGKNKAIIGLDGGLLTNFGPRTGEAAVALNRALAGIK